MCIQYKLSLPQVNPLINALTENVNLEYLSQFWDLAADEH